MSDSDQYLKKKQFYSGLLTIYGGKPVLEALHNASIEPFRLHLADSNKQSKEIKAMLDKASERGAEVQYHSREALSRLSKNRKQDQGVVLDVRAPNYQSTEALDPEQHRVLIALENVTNPQNIGMSIRSVGASPAAGVILAEKGNAPLDALVIKASAGTVFKSPIYHCSHLLKEIPNLKAKGYRVVGLSGAGKRELQELPTDTSTIYVLGNETNGLTRELMALCDELVKIPMSNQVESLNVSVAAALVAFRGTL